MSLRPEVVELTRQWIEKAEEVETAKRVREAVRNVLPRGVLEGDRG